MWVGNGRAGVEFGAGGKVESKGGTANGLLQLLIFPLGLGHRFRL
jgi:hypothetical protein